MYILLCDHFGVMVCIYDYVITLGYGMYILLCNHFGVMVCIYCYVITLGLWYVYTTM